MSSIIASLRGFKFNGKHNSSIGVVLHKKSIQSPSKKKVTDSVPFMNGSYDFSTIATNGELVFSEREITVTLGLPAASKEQLQVLYSKVLEWLMDVGKHSLIFDVMDDYYFMAEVQDVTTLEEVMEFGQMEVKFIADPFKLSINYVGSDLWDTFNFEEDYLQETTYDIFTSTTIVIHNPGRSVKPVINCTAAMTITKSGKTYSLTSGNNTPYGFYLTNGSNTITIKGDGVISFNFRKETL